MSKKQNSFKLSLCIPFRVGYHSVVDMFEDNNIKVHDLKRSTKDGHMIQIEFSNEMLKQKINVE